MPFASSIQRLSRRDSAIRAIARAWRELTGGLGRGQDPARRTLVACSGGADSSGLLLALAAAVSGPDSLFVVAHIVHDMRPEVVALADRDAAKELAHALGLPFVEAAVRPRRERGNAEAAARRLRYAALAKLARDNGCGFIATGHHADDQLESIIMNLLRGAGPRGLAGVARSRRLGWTGPVLIRPALGVERSELMRLCADAGWHWREDATNSDMTRLRAAVRGKVLPELRGLRPGASRRAARSAALLADASELVEERVRELLVAGGGGESAAEYAWPRLRLSRETSLVLGALLQRAAVGEAGSRGRDKIGSRLLDPVIAAIHAPGSGARRFRLLSAQVTVTEKAVEVQRAPDG